MAQTSEEMESGYKKIHRWCQYEFRQFTKETQLEVSPVMNEAIKRLRARQNLLKWVHDPPRHASARVADQSLRDALQTLTSTRQASTLTAFLDALTRGGPNGLPRPIELHAHDPTRYVGDMLAWIHQTTASEHEFLEGIFGVNKKRRMVGAVREVGGEEEGMVRESLDKDLEGLSRPLKVSCFASASRRHAGADQKLPSDADTANH